MSFIDGCGELFCGTVGGIIGKFVDFPFDTIKVRMQAADCKYTSTLNCIRRIAAEEGFWGFYSGVAAPVGGAAFENAIAFFVYGRGANLLDDACCGGAAARSASASATGGGGGAERPLWIIATAGAISGVGTGVVLTPVELVKCRVQTTPKRYPSVPACIRTTVREEGAGALMTGLPATLVREVPGNACWFGFYELTLRNCFIPQGKTRADAPWWAFPISGGVGGVFYWSVLFPADTVKTRMQTDAAYQRLGFVRCFRSMWAQGGARLMYSGFGITLCRAFPANATIFGVYELTDKKVWKRMFPPPSAAAAAA